jgi:hypothetical protein
MTGRPGSARRTVSGRSDALIPKIVPARDHQVSWSDWSRAGCSPLASLRAAVSTAKVTARSTRKKGPKSIFPTQWVSDLPVSQ